ncbi:hypothetical protein BaRGS_00029180 [Batillaria attramentaria]|uniref:VWFA domain-containing protein n=1 Tax=Batillaria attramentaria TaxID=370345 RepID=A0ABD0JXE5_9CAEN
MKCLQLFLQSFVLLALRVQCQDVSTNGKACSLDMMFVLDGSASITNVSFETALEAVRKTSLTFWKNSPQSRIGLVTYSTLISQVIPVTSDTSLFLSQIGTVAYPGGGTETNAGIQEAADQLKASARRSGRNLPQVIVLITDGKSNSKNRTLEAADAAKSAGIFIFAIGVGSGIDETELNAVRSNDGDTFNVDTFDLLASKLNDLISSVCDIVPRSTCPPPLVTVEKCSCIFIKCHCIIPIAVAAGELLIIIILLIACAAIAKRKRTRTGKRENQANGVGKSAATESGST